MRSTPHIVHISTVHNAADPRIRLKELRSAREAGLTAHLVTADPEAAETGDGVRVHRVAGRRGSRPRRMLLTAPRAVFRALRLPAAVYHFHDPELIPWAWLLLLRRAPVVYDVHEDYAVAVAHKQYLPAWLRRRLGRLVDVAERALTRPFRIVIAEDCYASRFPQGLRVRNYPPRSLLSVGPAFDARSRRLLYTGNVTEERGALNLAGVAAVASDLRITLVGRCSPALASRMRAIAGDAGASRMTIIGEGRYVPFSEIRARYAEGDWLCGTALFPDSPHYREKALTKFFEYMAAGLPVIASDVPFWRRLIVEQGLGICVNPTDPRAAVQAARRFAEDPAEAREMGRRGRELVRRHYNWEYQGAALVAFYRSLLRTV